MSKISGGIPQQQTATPLIQFQARFLSQGWSDRDELSQVVSMNSQYLWCWVGSRERVLCKQMANTWERWQDMTQRADHSQR